ncbi:S1 RNA-binding domain-containing protein [Actinokineospora sp. HUAS TT18]|uniref:S1 RNA-binding domain-containing protein n=1 Tax=Actinokineospora sp. HUAS TT18 TaxID=3447451 RepID=UPI003F51C498
MSSTDPWTGFRAAHDTGSEFEATVVSIVPFGAFLEIDGAHGLLHKSEWSAEPEVGSTMRVRVVAVDDVRQRFSLALS